MINATSAQASFTAWTKATFSTRGANAACFSASSRAGCQGFGRNADQFCGIQIACGKMIDEVSRVFRRAGVDNSIDQRDTDCATEIAQYILHAAGIADHVCFEPPEGKLRGRRM